MMLKLLPDQAARYWDSIKEALLFAPPPASRMTDDGLNEVLASLIDGRMQCWVIYRKTGVGTIVDGIVVTTLIVDLCSNARNLLVYCVHTYRRLEVGTAIAEFDTLKKYARSFGCSKIIGYTKDESWKGFVKKLGGEVAYIVSIPCDEEE